MNRPACEPNTETSPVSRDVAAEQVLPALHQGHQEKTLPVGPVTTLRSKHRYSHCHAQDDKAGQRKRKFL